MKDRFKIVQKDVLALEDGVYHLAECLYLRVRNQGKHRSYFFKIQIDGVRKEIAIGSAKKISLALAKIKAGELRSRIFNGEDIFEKPEKQKAKPTFWEVVERCIETTGKARKWKEHSYRIWERSLRKHAFPILGSMPIDEITKVEIVEVLEPIWYEITETASDVRGRLERIFEYATFMGWYDKPNPARWKGNLDIVFPTVSTISKENHFEALTFDELRDVCQRIRNADDTVRKAFLLIALTACRNHEAVKAKWDEFDLNAATWSIPPERRKDGKPYPHRIPLSTQAVELLAGLKRESVYVFKSPFSLGHITITTVLRFIKRASRENATVHGCRSVFRDWCAENGWDRILAEKSLMHTTGGAVENAYQRSDLLEQRRPLMQAWADALLSVQAK